MSLERIEITPFAVIAGEILQNRRSGLLTIVHAPIRRELYWSQGELVLAVPALAEQSLGAFLSKRANIPPEAAAQLGQEQPTNVAARFHELGLFDMSVRQTLLREWISALFLPLFQLDEGTSAFEEDQPIAPEKRVFLQSTAALVLEGVRQITNGLVLRRSLGDLKREMEPSRESRFDLNSVALTDSERKIAESLHERQPIETFLKSFANESLLAAKVVIGMLALGIFTTALQKTREETVSFDDMQRDMELLAAIGPGDARSLRAVKLARQLPSMDHYQFLEVARGAARGQLMGAAEGKRKMFDPETYPAAARESAENIIRRIDQAVAIFKDPNKRAAYDKLLQTSGSRDESFIEQRLQQQSLAAQNVIRAHDLTVQGDYYGAILLLKQAVRINADDARAWLLLGSCQERNPKWRREAAESYQRVLSIDPTSTDAMIALGDIYKTEGLISRAQSCYEDVIKIAPDNQQARSRLAALKK